MRSTHSTITYSAVRSSLLSLVLLSAACSSSVERQSAAANSHAADTAVIDIRQPTVIAHFVTTQAEVDSNPDLGEALSDFQYHLGGARATLTDWGVALEERYAPVVRYRVAGRVVRFAPPRDSAVAYLLLAKDFPPQIYYGVLTDSDLLDRVRRFLTVPGPR